MKRKINELHVYAVLWFFTLLFGLYILLIKKKAHLYYDNKKGYYVIYK